MTTSTDFCPVCGAVNDSTLTHCFACGQSLRIENKSTLDQVVWHNRYQLEALLGSGGFSAVYRARDRQEGGRDVAIKRISLQGLNAEETIEATHTFHRELSMLSALIHPQVPRLYDHFNDQDHWYLILEYLEGQALDAYLALCEVEDKRVQMEEILDIALQLCTVLDYLHSRQPPIIFRDLKPSNILRTPIGKLYLIDFGIARRYQPGQTRDTQRLGSPGYAAPEQYGRAQTTPQADIYSLGALLHFLLSGQDPANSPLGLTPLRLHSQPGSAELELLVAQMLSPNPTERPASVRAVAKALDQVRQQAGTDDAQRIWVPPPLQPPLPSDGPQLRIQLPPSAGLVWPSSDPSASRSGWLSRRRVLIALGALTVATGAGVGIRWSVTPPLSPFSTYQGSSFRVVWSPDGKRLASASGDTVQIWNIADGSNVYTYHGHLDMVRAVAWSPDGKRLASGDLRGTVRIWDASDEGPVLVYAGHSLAVYAVTWSPDGKRLVSAFQDATVQIWDATTGRAILDYGGHSDVVNAVVWSPDGKCLASASDDHTVQVWNATTGRTILTYRGHSDIVNGVVWSPDGKRLASASRDHTVQIWNATTGETILTYQGHSSWVSTVAWSPDGKHLVSASIPTTVQVWNVTTGKTILNYSGHSYWVYDVAWSPNGNYIAWAGADDVEIWTAP